MRHHRRHILPTWAVIISFVLAMIVWAAFVDAALPAQLVETVKEVFK